LRLTAFNPKIVQGTGHLHHLIRKTSLGVAQDIFNNPTPFDPSDGVLNDNARPGQQPVQPLIGRT
jgi:hypothetical protein